MLVNLKEKPFYLKDDQIEWVEKTIAEMSDEEKIGQLFVGLVTDREPQALQRLASQLHVGAIRYHNAPPEVVYEQNRILQEAAKIPLLIASNCENGGYGGVEGGTLYANGAAVAAADSEDMAYEMGKIGAQEAAAVGCNWNFAPVVDLLFNWRNTIVQTRAFNDSPQDTIRYARAFMRGTRTENIATCCKHFPGDGTEENDQHLLMGVNDLDMNQWEETFGQVYRAVIEDGVMTIMAGHIALPAYSRLKRPGIRDSEILPATLSPEIIDGLLKTELGFNGLVVTDASHMIGMFAAMPRKEQVPRAIAAGCDMFLFFNDQEEDFSYMMDGYRRGIITQERLHEALRRILGLKASLGLHRLKQQGALMPQKERLSVIGSEQHRALARKAADQFVTLVKDTRNYLPIRPDEHRRIRLFFLSGDGKVIAGKLMKDDSHKVKEHFIQALEKEGFIVEESEQTEKGKMEEFKKKYDLCLVVINLIGFAQYNTMRMKWKQPVEQPWYVSEVPTVFVSLNFTNHLIDIPMAKAYINAYVNSDEAIDAVVEKMTGKSEFHGRYNENVFCGRWDTKL